MGVSTIVVGGDTIWCIRHESIAELAAAFTCRLELCPTNVTVAHVLQVQSRVKAAAFLQPRCNISTSGKEQYPMLSR